MTEYLNKRFKEVLSELEDPRININNVVFHSLRHTSAGVKLKISKGDLKAVQGDGGWNSPDMITKRYAHILDEDRRKLAEAMDESFYGNTGGSASQGNGTPDLTALITLLGSNPELLKQALQTIQLANKP